LYSNHESDNPMGDDTLVISEAGFLREFLARIMSKRNNFKLTLDISGRWSGST